MTDIIKKDVINFFKNLKIKYYLFNKDLDLSITQYCQDNNKEYYYYLAFKEYAKEFIIDVINEKLEREK
jgi:site-specific DNA-adenine methylase